MYVYISLLRIDFHKITFIIALEFNRTVQRNEWRMQMYNTSNYVEFKERFTINISIYDVLLLFNWYNIYDISILFSTFSFSSL